MNDVAAALILASAAAINFHSLTPIARVVDGASAGVASPMMGIRPAPTSKKLMVRLGLTIDDFSIIELNEVFVSQWLANLRELGVCDRDPRINPNGGAKALCTMCIDVGQGISVAIENFA